MNFDPALEAPWLLGPLQQLRSARRAGRFPPALLIHERRGAGGLWLAQRAAQLALCTGEEPSCGRCRACRQFLAGQHPDFIAVEPLEDSKLIRIEQIRALADDLALTAHGGGASAALLHPADAMNASAANALLKTLEEPRAGMTLMLVTELPSRLPPTVLSRCLRLHVDAPARAEAIAWLERHKGPGPWGAVLDVIGEAPFEAALLDAAGVARLAGDTFDTLGELLGGERDLTGIAERWARGEQFELRLACIETWLTACIDRAAGAPRQLAELRTGAHLPEVRWDMNIAGLLGLLDAAYELRGLRLTSINRSLALEQLLWQLTRVRLRAAAS